MVHYTADSTGFHPKVTYEGSCQPAGSIGAQSHPSTAPTDETPPEKAPVVPVPDSLSDNAGESDPISSTAGEISPMPSNAALADEINPASPAEIAVDHKYQMAALDSESQISTEELNDVESASPRDGQQDTFTLSERGQTMSVPQETVTLDRQELIKDSTLGSPINDAIANEHGEKSDRKLSDFNATVSSGAPPAMLALTGNHVYQNSQVVPRPHHETKSAQRQNVPDIRYLKSSPGNYRAAAYPARSGPPGGGYALPSHHYSIMGNNRPATAQHGALSYPQHHYPITHPPPAYNYRPYDPYVTSSRTLPVQGSTYHRRQPNGLRHWTSIRPAITFYGVKPIRYAAMPRLKWYKPLG